MQGAFLCCFSQALAGMSRDLGRDVPGSERNFMQENLGPIFRTLRKIWALSKGLLMAVSKRWFEFCGGTKIPLPPLYLNFTSFLPNVYLNLTSARPAISNHGLETTVYRPLGCFAHLPEVKKVVRFCPAQPA